MTAPFLYLQNHFYNVTYILKNVIYMLNLEKQRWLTFEKHAQNCPCPSRSYTATVS